MNEIAYSELILSIDTRMSLREGDAAANLKEQVGMDIIYQAKLKRYLDRKDTLAQNLAKAHASYLQHILQQGNAESD
jgi:hypothetical protein